MRCGCGQIAAVGTSNAMLDQTAVAGVTYYYWVVADFNGGSAIDYLPSNAVSIPSA